MKQIFTFIAILIGMVMTPTSTKAYDFEVDGIYYNIVSFTDLTCEITAGNEKYTGDIIIPAQISYNSRNLEIIGIASKAFYECSALTAISIPNSITKIGDNAFYECTSLNSISLPESLTLLGDYVFGKCTSLGSVSIPESVTQIGAGAFRECTSLSSVSIPEGIVQIEDRTFDGCTSLKSVSLPQKITSIGNKAFNNCSKLSYISIPESVSLIGDWAFSNCSSLTSITIPNNVIEIGEFAFNKCKKIENIKLSNNVTALRLGLFSDCSSLKSLTIPGNIHSMELGSIVLRWEKYYPIPGQGVYWYLEYLSDCPSLFKSCSNLNEIRFEYSPEPIKATRYYDAQKEETLEPIQRWEDVSVQLMYYSWHYRYEMPENTYLPIKRIFMDRELGNSLELPFLTDLILGEHIKEVEIYPESSPDLKYIECQALTPPNTPSFTNDQYMNVVLRVPEESLDIYKQTDKWKNFWNIQSIESAGVEDIHPDIISKEIGRYNINGQKVDDSYQGIVIIRYSDGSTRKIVRN